MPNRYHAEGLDDQVLEVFGIKAQPPKLDRWKEIVHRVRQPEGEVKIAVVGKYTKLKDAYKSLNEALVHGGIANNVKVGIEWVESEVFETPGAVTALEDVHGILVPGGFGERGHEGKIEAAHFARTRNVPYFGICFGMQMAVIESVRNLLGLKDADSNRVRPDAGAGDRLPGGMGQRQRARETAQERRHRRDDAPSAPIRRRLRPEAGWRRSTVRPRFRSAHRHRFE